MSIVLGTTAALVSAGGAIAAVSEFMYKLAIKRTSKEFLSQRSELGELDEWQKQAQANEEWRSAHPFEELTLYAYDGLKLHGYYFAANIPTHKLAILVHGYSGQGLDMATYAGIYTDTLGFNVFMPDNRGHGKSEGHYIGFGWHDRLDILKWIEYFVERFAGQVEIVLHGVSMGGATVLMTSGENLPSQVKAIVADCAYTSVHEELTYQLKQMFKLPRFPLLYTTSIACRLHAGYSFKEATALEQVKRARTPILFIHGEEDTFVPTHMVHPLHEHCGSEKELWLVPGAAHGASVLVDYEGYRERTGSFVTRYMSK